VTDRLRPVTRRASRPSTDPLGKAALFTRAAAGDERGDDPAEAAPSPAPPVVRSVDQRARALGGPAGPIPANLGGGEPPTRWRPCTVELHCRGCLHRTRVSLLAFALLNLPMGWWLPIPGMHFNRFMTCPACGERTWVHASWLP
jgi:hypothetical protein